MKFTCSSCSAQYMISDEKVGPSGVKVRCKKCGNVIVVRRAAEAGAPAAAAPAASGGAPSGGPGAGLDAELGSAFDHAFGDSPQQAKAGPAPDLGDTQAMGSDDAAKVFASAGGAPAATEWYVAIGQAQVGPLPLAEVKKKWEAGDIGPDSLVWRPGMADWSPLTTVSELAGYLAPVPRPAPQAGRAPEPERAARAEQQQAAAEVTWKPIGASALAALASEEIATRAAPEPRPAARPAAGARSLVDALPDGGGVDPTGALPLNLKALEATTGEKKIERRSSVARGVEQARRRSTARAVVTGIAVGILLVGGAGAAAAYLYNPKLLGLRPAAPIAAAPPAAEPPSAEPPSAEPPAQPAAAVAPPATQEPAPQPAVATAPPAPAPSPAAAPPAAEKPGAPAAAPSRRETRRETARREATRVSAAPPQEEPPPPPPTRRKGGDLLDFESNDAALNAALGGGSSPSSRSVYVPPRASSLPDKVSPGDINGAVAQRIDSLRRCVSEQKAREPDATGTLKMRWIIQADGSPQDVKCITPEYAKGAFAQCIVGVLRTVQFPRSTTKGQEVTFPFNF